MRPLPIVESCDGCGARCCQYMRTPPYIWTANDMPPVHLQDEVRAASLDDRPNEAPCIWIDGERCRHHEHRPRACRDFQRGCEHCVALRSQP